MVRHFPLSRLVILSIFLTSPALADPDPAKEKRYLANVKQLTFDGVKSGEAYFSPDGKKIVFQSVRAGSPHYQIYMMNVDGSNQRMVSTGKGKTTCAYFNPANPKEFIFASTHLDSTTWGPVKKKGRGYSWDFDKSMDIFLARSSDGKIIKRLTTVKGYDAEGSYSPDGKHIVYTSTSEDKTGDLYIMNADGSNRRRLTKVAGYDGGPFFSPDGKRVVFRAFRGKGGRSAQVFTIKIDGTDEKQLTWLPRVNWCPIYHPNGKYIIYSANTGSRHNFELFLVKADGSGEVQISHSAGFDGLPCFSPDGNKKGAVFEEAERLYDQLLKEGLSVVFEDRKLSFGALFNDLELLGFPYWILVGRSWKKEGKVELRSRSSDDVQFFEPEAAVNWVKEQVRSHRVVN